jgi:hypothetical protein
MEGRAVNKELTNKEGQVYNSWVQMDFKQTDSNGNFKLNQYHQNYGYDLEATLGKLPIKELETPKYKEDLMDSLKKGNLQSATFFKDGSEVKQFVEVNPQFKTINVYDTNRKRIENRESKGEKQREGDKVSVKQGGKKRETNTDSEEPDVPKAKKRIKKQSNSM